jgi:elongation factor 1-gamma
VRYPLIIVKNTLLTHPTTGNSRVRRILAAAALAGVELEHDKSFTFKNDWKTPEFLAKFPMGYVPVLEDGDLYLQECGAIAEYGKSSSPFMACVGA